MDMLIVDGYNVIHALDRYRRINKSDRDTAVEALIRDMVNLAGSGALDVIVVFDGGGQASETQRGPLKIIYSGAARTADAVIERLVYGAAGGTAVAVCTADAAQQQIVGRKEARRMAPRELEDMMADAVEEREETPRKRTRFRLEDRLPDSVRAQMERLRRPDCE